MTFGRLTLVSGVSIPITDSAGQTTVFFTPCGGNTIDLYDGLSYASLSFSELSLSLDAMVCHENYHQNGKLFDFFVFSLAGVLRLGTGPQWATTAFGTSARGSGDGTTELELFEGVWVNKNPIVIRYGAACSNIVEVYARCATFVGSGCMTADGQIDDTQTKRYLGNVYNRVERLMTRTETAASWSYSLSMLRQVLGSAANQLNVVVPLAGNVAEASAGASWLNSSATESLVVTDIGVNSTTTIATTNRAAALCTSTRLAATTAHWRGYLPLGINYLSWLERGAGTADIQTVGNNPTIGINGKVFN